MSKRCSKISVTLRISELIGYIQKYDLIIEGSVTKKKDIITVGSAYSNNF